MAIETRLIAKIGEVGRKLHTARSRNDQVALDVRLYLAAEVEGLHRALTELRRAGARLARRHLGVMMPGYTHLQRAQPILFAHHLLAYDEMWRRECCACRSPWPASRSRPWGPRPWPAPPSPSIPQFTAAQLGFPRGLPQQPGRGERPGFSAGISGPRQHHHGPSEPPGGGTHPLVRVGIRLCGAAGRLRHRVLHHAPEKKP